MATYCEEGLTRGHVSLVSYVTHSNFQCVIFFRSIFYVGPAFSLFLCKKKVKRCTQAKDQTIGAYPGFLIMKHAQEYCYSSLDGTLKSIAGLPPQQYVARTIYTPE